MNDDVIDADHTAIAVIEEPRPAPVGLFGTNDPVEVIERAVRVADALKSVIRSKKLIANIQGKEFLTVEAWTTLGAMLGVFPFTEWTRPTENGWEARVVVRTREGIDIAAAEAQCTRDEKSWGKRDDYALRSMAQTRAVSKAMRLPLGFVATLAGYEATPADEVPPQGFKAAPAPKPEPRGDDTAEAHRKAVAAVMALCRSKGIIDPQRHALTNKLFDVSSTADLDIQQLRALYKELSAFAEGYQ